MNIGLAAKTLFLCLLMILLVKTGPHAEAAPLTRTCSSGVEVSIDFETDRLVALQPVPARLRIVDAAGAPVSGALVYCSLYIPNFATGSNSPKLKPGGQDGVYEGLLVFSREGTWNADLTINLPNGNYEEVTFTIERVLPGSVL